MIKHECSYCGGWEEDNKEAGDGPVAVLAFNWPAFGWSRSICMRCIDRVFKLPRAHEWDTSMVYASFPSKHRCKKCGEFEVI